MSKIKLITHTDEDGLFPVILSKLVFPDLEYVLANVDEVEEKVKETLEHIEDYEHVYVTDLNITRELAQKIEDNPTYKDHITIIDHHLGKMDMNDFSFITVIDTDLNGVKQSATSLFYAYLLQNFEQPKLHTSCVKKLVEYVRKLDTWTWQDEPKSKWIGNLLDIFGRDYFISHFYQYILEHDTFEFEEKDIYLIEVEQLRIQNYIEKKKEEIFPIDTMGYHIGVIFSDRYTSEVGNALSEMYRDTYDLIAMIKMSKGHVSYRAVKDEVDLTVFSKKLGGNGHKHAAGSPVAEQLIKELVQKIFAESEI